MPRNQWFRVSIVFKVWDKNEGTQNKGDLFICQMDLLNKYWTKEDVLKKGAKDVVFKKRATVPHLGQTPQAVASFKISLVILVTIATKKNQKPKSPY
jgi:hypothetical protein